MNAVAFADSSSQLLFSGSDDALCKVWDRRTLREDRPQPVGHLAGHRDGITFIHSKVGGGSSSSQIFPSGFLFSFFLEKSFMLPFPGRRPISDQQLQGPVHQAVGHQEVLPQGGAGGVPPGRDPAELGLPLAAGSPERWVEAGGGGGWRGWRLEGGGL